MTVYSSAFQVKSQGFSDVHDITSKVETVLADSKISSGIAAVFVSGSTAAITTIEFEGGVIEDLKRAVERLAPQSIHYDHDVRWGDGNGFSHVRASLLGPSLTVPFTGSQLQLGAWQQIVLIDFDNRARTREVKVQILGE